MIGAKTMSRMALTLAAVVLVGFAAPGDKDGERIKRLVDKPGKTASLGELVTEVRAQLIARTAMPSETLKTIRRYQHETTDGIYKIVLFDIAWRGKTYRLGASTTPEGATYKVGIFDEFGKEVPEFDDFLGQFRGDYGVGLTEASNEDLGAILKRRDALATQTKPPAKPAEKKAWTLLKHHQSMMKLGAIWREIDLGDKSNEPLAKNLKALDEATAKLEEFSTNLRATMEPKTVGGYREVVKAMRADVAEALKLATAGDDTGATKIAREKIVTHCSKCHESDQNEFKTDLASALGNQLGGIGFKKGAFVVDVDVDKRDYTPEEAQMLANTIKACLLSTRD